MLAEAALVNYGKCGLMANFEQCEGFSGIVIDYKYQND